MLRAIREIQPGYVVGENVRGLTNWNGGLVFDQVQADLEAEGYEVLPFLLPACGVNAPHRRDRIWFIAYNNNRNGKEVRFQTRAEINVHDIEGSGNDGNTELTGFQGRKRIYKSKGSEQGCKSVSEPGIVTNPKGIRMERNRAVGQQKPGLQTEEKLPGCNSTGTNWSDWPTQPPLRWRNDGLSSRLSGITFSKHRNESIKAYGNAIVPQVALQIFKAIEQMELNKAI